MDNSPLISSVRRAGYLLVKLSATISMDNYIEVERNIGALLSGKNDRVVLDLADTTNIYSSGMGLIIRLRKKVAEGGGMVCLVNVSERCRLLLQAVHLDKVLPIYATDVEFEISQDDVWEKKKTEGGAEFILINRVEDGVCRIGISGHMTLSRDLSVLDRPLASAQVSRYVFDLTGLDAVDSAGANSFSRAIMAVHAAGGRCVAYGAAAAIRDTLALLGLDEYLPCHADEREALKAIGKA